MNRIKQIIEKGFLSPTGEIETDLDITKPKKQKAIIRGLRDLKWHKSEIVELSKNGLISTYGDTIVKTNIIFNNKDVLGEIVFKLDVKYKINKKDEYVFYSSAFKTPYYYLGDIEEDIKKGFGNFISGLDGLDFLHEYEGFCIFDDIDFNQYKEEYERRLGVIQCNISDFNDISPNSEGYYISRKSHELCINDLDKSFVADHYFKVDGGKFVYSHSDWTKTKYSEDEIETWFEEKVQGEIIHPHINLDIFNCSESQLQEINDLLVKLGLYEK